MKMKVKATFIGQDGSLGFKTGQQYELEVEAYATLGFDQLRIEPSNCIYESLNAFLNNWSNVTKVL